LGKLISASWGPPASAAGAAERCLQQQHPRQHLQQQWRSGGGNSGNMHSSNMYSGNSKESDVRCTV